MIQLDGLACKRYASVVGLDDGKGDVFRVEDWGCCFERNGMRKGKRDRIVSSRNFSVWSNVSVL